ncbi:hypothetical protein BRADI_3g29055v3 [Brachypodium distachyon]|uniref:Uncharacterized protein n=1 Tax=Brachypodium distachyon TaxID=15368 RepID=A0A2K2CZW7_BRADI|nr:hypothetical protein BRADI_3g29055v3 [Brachypodium distachyon]
MEWAQLPDLSSPRSRPCVEHLLCIHGDSPFSVSCSVWSGLFSIGVANMQKRHASNAVAIGVSCLLSVESGNEGYSEGDKQQYQELEQQGDPSIGEFFDVEHDA